MDISDIDQDELQDLYRQAHDADTRKVNDMYTFDLSKHERFKVVLNLYWDEYVSEVGDRSETENRLRLMHESNLMNVDEFMFTQPGVPAVAYLLGETASGEWERIESKRELDIRADFICMDCGMDTFRDEYYSVQTELWDAATEAKGDGKGMLCVGCLEARIGRRLVPADFPDAPVNNPEIGHKSERLLERLRG